MQRLFAAMAFAGVLASSATAADLIRSTDGYSYFHRAGADRAAHDRDIWTCRAVARQLHPPAFTPVQNPVVVKDSPRETLYYGIGSALGNAIAAGYFYQLADSKGDRVNLENCMVAQGWNVVVVPPAEGKALSGKALQAALDGWVGAPQPHGATARTFRNDVTRPGTSIFSWAIKKGVSLSDKAVGAPRKEQADALAESPPAYLPQPRPKGEPKPKPPVVVSAPVGPADLVGPFADARLAIRVDGGPWMSLYLERLGPDAATPGWRDGKTGVVEVKGPWTGDKAGSPEDTVVYALPPGRWRLAAATVYGVTISFCLGGPAFDLAAGDVAYAGAFRFDQFVPDMALQTARTALPPALADKVRPVEWLNGAQGSCLGNYAYVLELPDRPFLPGYALGSHASGAPGAR